MQKRAVQSLAKNAEAGFALPVALAARLAVALATRLAIALPTVLPTVLAVALVASSAAQAGPSTDSKNTPVPPAKPKVSLVIAPPTKNSRGCDLKEAGFTEKESFLKFFAELKISAEKNDPKGMIKFMLFPVRVIGKSKFTVRNEFQFVEKYPVIVTDAVRAAIAAQAIDKLYCRNQGVMYGDGEVWVGVDKGRVGIITLREPGL